MKRFLFVFFALFLIAGIGTYKNNVFVVPQSRGVL